MWYKVVVKVMVHGGEEEEEEEEEELEVVTKCMFIDDIGLALYMFKMTASTRHWCERKCVGLDQTGGGGRGGGGRGGGQGQR